MFRRIYWDADNTNLVLTVEPPRVLDRDPVLVRRVQGGPQGAHGPLEHGRVRLVELEAVELEQLARTHRLERGCCWD